MVNKKNGEKEKFLHYNRHKKILVIKHTKTSEEFNKTSI